MEIVTVINTGITEEKKSTLDKYRRREKTPNESEKKAEEKVEKFPTDVDRYKRKEDKKQIEPEKAESKEIKRIIAITKTEEKGRNSGGNI